MYTSLLQNSPKYVKQWKPVPLACSLVLISFLSMTYLKNTSDMTKSIGQNVTPGTYIDQEGVCVNALPFAKLHHEDAQEVETYNQNLIDRAGGFATTYGEIDPPELKILPPGSSFAFWECAKEDFCDFDHILIKASAWTANGEEAFTQDKYEDVDQRVIWVSHSKYDFLGNKRTTLKGDTAAMFGFFANNYGHVLHDNFPLLAYLKDSVPRHTNFVLPDTKRYRDLISFIEPQFLERIYFYQKNEIITVEEGTLTVANSKSGKFLSPYGNTLFRHMRHWIFENHPEQYPEKERHIIFHTRGAPNTNLTRRIDFEQEKDILAIVQANMAKYNRKEKLVFFSGTDEDGNILPYTEQFDIFRRASVIIGPHGSGLANIMWTDPFPKSCDDRVQVLEFIGGTDSDKVHNPLFNGYYWVMRGMPIDWHQITYAPNSTKETTYLRLKDLKRALSEMWG